MKQGIIIAGSILVDKINEISVYPECGKLTKIAEVKKSVGGLVPNVAIDLKRLCPDLTVYASGKVGNDQEGDYVVERLKNEGIDVSGIKRCKQNTSFTEVMSVVGGQRTFFTYAGASAEYGEQDIDLEKYSAKMLHLGYFLLLDKIDNGEGEKILKKAKELGIKTSIDLVSENSDRYSIVVPCLKFVDNLIINEQEAEGITGLSLKSSTLKEIAKRLLEMGVRERVIIHTSSLGLVMSQKSLTVSSSLQLPDNFIKGTTGAGDAFSAGALLGIYLDESDEKILELAMLSATASLSSADAVSGMESLDEITKKYGKFERKEICL